MVTSTASRQPRILRMGHPLAFAAFLRQVGAPVDKYFRRAGLPTLCENPNAFVPLHKAWAFMNEAAQSVDPSLGWHVGRFVGQQNLNGDLLQKLKNAPSLFNAIQLLIRLSSVEASHVHLGIIERPNHILLFTHYPSMKGEAGYTSSQSYQIGAILGVIRQFIGESWIPDEIGVEFPVVPDIAKEFLPSSRVLARQKAGYIAIPRSYLHLPPPSRAVRSEGSGEQLPSSTELDYPDTLRALLKPYLSEGYPSASLAASLIDTSIRTLARRLSDSGTTYRQLVDNLRFDEAKNLLKNTNAQIIDVAGAVGFDDPAHFARMFRRIGGISPHEFRKIIH